MFLRQPQPTTTKQQAIEIQKTIWSNLKAQLGALISETSGEPVDSAERGAHLLQQVIQSLVGDQGIFYNQA